MKLGKQIRQIRLIREYSQDYLGSETGIGQKRLSRIENNRVSPNYDELQQIAKVLAVKLPFLLEFNTIDLLNELQMRCLDDNKKWGGYICK